MPRSRRDVPAPSCDGCFFRAHGLCALPGDEPCPTFRPNRPEGLRPPRQLALHLDRPNLGRAVAFPSAHEQAARHAA